jgi:hypothetical protein
MTKPIARFFPTDVLHEELAKMIDSASSSEHFRDLVERVKSTVAPTAKKGSSGAKRAAAVSKGPSRTR